MKNLLVLAVLAIVVICVQSSTVIKPGDLDNASAKPLVSDEKYRQTGHQSHTGGGNSGRRPVATSHGTSHPSSTSGTHTGHTNFNSNSNRPSSTHGSRPTSQSGTSGSRPISQGVGGSSGSRPTSQGGTSGFRPISQGVGGSSGSRPTSLGGSSGSRPISQGVGGSGGSRPSSGSTGNHGKVPNKHHLPATVQGGPHTLTGNVHIPNSNANKNKTHRPQPVNHSSGRPTHNSGTYHKAGHEDAEIKLATPSTSYQPSTVTQGGARSSSGRNTQFGSRSGVKAPPTNYQPPPFGHGIQGSGFSSGNSVNVGQHGGVKVKVPNTNYVPPPV